MRHIVSVLVENQFGVLARVAGMFSGRGFNIDTLNVGPTHDPARSRITVVVKGDDAQLDQCIKQLGKLINVIEIVDFKSGGYVARELVLVKVATTPANRSEVMQICDIFRARIVDVGPASLVIEVTGDEGKLKGFLDLLSPFGILEVARTGAVALERGENNISNEHTK